MKNVICTICMRGGSKGVPNKNLRLMHGKPLMAYSIEQAFGCGIFEHVIITALFLRWAQQVQKTNQN